MQIKNKEWESWELKYLHENYGLKSARAIAKHLNRTVDSVYSKAKREKLNVYKRVKKIYHVYRNGIIYKSGSAEKLSKVMNVSVDYIKNLASPSYSSRKTYAIKEEVICEDK